jgi:hypothetical protein
MMDIFDSTALNISKELTIEKRNGEYEQLNKVELSIFHKYNGLNIIGTITVTLYGVDGSNNLISIGTGTISYTTEMLASDNIEKLTRNICNFTPFHSYN